MSEWQDISTAPRDGTRVRLKAGADACVGSFRVHSDGDAAEWRMHSKDIGWCRDHPPTHWQPLPAPPEPSA